MTTTTNSSSNNEKNDFPPELKERVKNFHEKLMEMRNLMEPLLASSALESKEALNALDKARFDISLSYGMTSLLWAFMLTQGEDPKETALKVELGRIREHMGRVREVEDRDKRPRVEPATAKRFVRGALYNVGDAQQPAAKRRHHK